MIDVMRLVHLVTGTDGQSHVREETGRPRRLAVGAGIRFEETAPGGTLVVARRAAPSVRDHACRAASSSPRAAARRSRSRPATCSWPRTPPAAATSGASSGPIRGAVPTSPWRNRRERAAPLPRRLGARALHRGAPRRPRVRRRRRDRAAGPPPASTCPTCSSPAVRPGSTAWSRRRSDRCARPRSGPARRSWASTRSSSSTGHVDGVIEYGLPLRRDLAAVIRRVRPDLVRVDEPHRELGWSLVQHGRPPSRRSRRPRRRARRRQPLDLHRRRRALARSAPGGDGWLAARRPTSSTWATTIDVGVASLREHAAYIDGPRHRVRPRRVPPRQRPRRRRGCRLRLRGDVPALRALTTERQLSAGTSAARTFSRTCCVASRPATNAAPVSGCSPTPLAKFSTTHTDA